MNKPEFIEKCKQIFTKEPFYEMSKAFSYKDRHIEVCAWVENPTAVDNRYFKYYNSMYYDNADKVARIRIDKAEYVGGNHKEGKKKKWILSKSEKDELMEILKGPSEEYEGLTRWQDIIITYNQDNFSLPSSKTIKGDLDDSKRNPKMPKYIKPLPIDTPIPNYLEL